MNPLSRRIPRWVLCAALCCVVSSCASTDSGVPAPSDVARPPADAKVTRKGVFYKVLSRGTGNRHPGPRDRVTVHYTGWTTDGKMFDTSYKSGQRLSFGLNEVIPGWTDGLQTMVVGEKTRFWIPQRMAYNGAPKRPHGMLVFDVELFRIR